MQISTKKKLEEIQSMLDTGATEKEIIKSKFDGSVKRYNAWIEKYGSYLTKNPAVIPVEGTAIVEKERAINPMDMGNMQILEKIFKDADILFELIENGKDIISSLAKKQNIEEINILAVPEELLKMNDIKYKSFRVSEKVEAEFNDFAERHKQYTKTSLLNMALIEFIEKYK